MVDFFVVSTKSVKRGYVEIYPKFIVKKSKDLMIRGKDFYAIWLEDEKRWSTNEDDAFALIDRELDSYLQQNRDRIGADVVTVSHMWDADSGMVDKWHKYCQKQLSDSYHPLDEKLMFENSERKKTDYASKYLPYILEQKKTPAFDKLMSVLYEPKEREKLEWAVGSIVSGDSVKLQKFFVLYGPPGSGKSTVLYIIEDLFGDYVSSFSSKALGNSNSSFALEAFRTNPLIAIDHEGDLSRADDNTRLNSLVSHDAIVVNEKFKSTYTSKFKALLFVGTNTPVRITDGKSGLLRRLVDVHPSGRKLPVGEYNQLMAQVKFELGGIAYKCREVYLADKHKYDSYIPTAMLDESNDFYNFVLDNYLQFSKDNYAILRPIWLQYKEWAADANIPHALTMRAFKTEMKNYFTDYFERDTLDDGTPVHSVFKGFKRSIFDEQKGKKSTDETKCRLILKEQKSIFDEFCADCLAQYAKADESPKKAWNDVKTTLSKIDTSKLHYVRVPKEHIVIDFDLKDEKGNKSFKLNSEAAALWPPTYAEVSKGGEGIHLHYIYNGDIDKLSPLYSEGIEVKVYKGKSALRRRLTKCNELPIATISSGLPLKETKKVVNFETLKSEKALRNLIIRNLAKDIHPGTKPSMDFIKKILDDAYESDLSYDVSDMKSDIIAFALGSTHQKDYCLALAQKLHYMSKNNEEGEYISGNNDKEYELPITMYDVEVFPNLFVNCYARLDVVAKSLADSLGVEEFSIDAWKKADDEIRTKAWNRAKDLVLSMVNPSDKDIEELTKHYRLVGFNCRRYDNHILYARMQGYSNQQLYKLSQQVIDKEEPGTGIFAGAYNLSYTDIWDYAANKQSLKRWEIDLQIHHQELGLPWDEPVSEELWDKVADYCKNDVLATIFVWFATEGDFKAREILAKLAGLSVNTSTNKLTTKIIFGDENAPTLVYTNLTTGEQFEGR